MSRLLLERERLWPEVWLLLATEGQLPTAGDWMSIDVGAESVLLVRGDDSAIRAFHNVCPHRGNVLCTGRRGNTPRLRCGYHGWTYDLDGSEAQNRGTMAPVRCEVFAGFVWGCMSDQAPPLVDYLGPMAPRLEAIDIGAWGRTSDLSVDLACNWLISADAHIEADHVPVLHPGVDIDAVSVDLLGLHGALRVELLVGGASSSNEMLYVFPNTQLNVHPGSAMLFQHLPHAADPSRCVFRQQVFGPAGSAEPQHRWVGLDDEQIGQVTAADLHICERVQRGVGSRGFTAPRFMEGEALLAHARAGIESYLS